MNDEPTHPATHPVIEALRDRKRQIELDLATNTARLEEVNDMLAMLQGPRRGRPRRPPPPPTEAETAEAMRNFDELMNDSPAPDATPGTTPTGTP
jgi:hypothetical protein